ncbi:F-box containing protein-like protein [Sarcoptes scabiei]|uniref:F-box containing protein-like protein n=1 Tax=Sarcoptes scabiei TaxID=52283 RepID=A0A132A518_SARSC|nr:F-box containing protein-like protein [Sarcoptes scabiei]
MKNRQMSRIVVTNVNTTTAVQRNQSKHQTQPIRSTSLALKHSNHNDRNERLQEGDWKNLPLVILYKIFSYLGPEDRLRSSTTCSSWRNVIYHSTLWPKKHLKVNLCPHKFSLSDASEASDASGFHTFRLKASYMLQQYLQEAVWLPILRTNPTNYHQQSSQNQQSYCCSQSNQMNHHYYYQQSHNYRKPNRKNFNEQLKAFIQKCSRFLSGITFYFDPNSSHNVLDLIKIIKFLSENEVAIYELNESKKQNYFANCRNLRYFAIVPVTTLVRCISDQRFMSLYSGLNEAIRFLFSKCNQLEHVSLGNLHEVIHATDTFFTQFLKTGVNEKLCCLNLSSIKGDIYRYIPVRSTLHNLEQFNKLQYVSFDFDILNTQRIKTLSRIGTLQNLIINVHRYNRNHPGIAKDVWQTVIERLPNLSVDLNLLHTESNSFQIILDSLLNTVMPLKRFRAYYLEFREENSSMILCNLLDVLSRSHSDRLVSFTLIDYTNNPKNHLKKVTPNVLVMLAWRCRNLSDLTVIGYQLTDMDIVAMARLRGRSLKTFHFPASCIQLTERYMKLNESLCFEEIATNFDLASPTAQRFFREIVSKPLKRTWHPIPISRLPDIVETKFLSQTTYHRTIIEQNDQCFH